MFIFILTAVLLQYVFLLSTDHNVFTDKINQLFK